MENRPSTVMNEVVTLLSNNAPREQITHFLLGKGYDDFQVHSIIEECIQLQVTRKRTLGISLIVGGAFICLISCVTTLLSDSLTASNFTLFGLTTLGIIVVFAGLTKVF